MDREHRGTIFLEDAELLAAREHEGRQITMRLAAPRIAARALPGSFVHIQCGPDLPMRRPLSLMRVDRAAGWLEVLFKILGHGLERLAETRPGPRVSVLGPVGRGFTLGRPLSILLSLKEPGANAAVTLLHTGVPDWADLVLLMTRTMDAAGWTSTAAGWPGAAGAPSV